MTIQYTIIMLYFRYGLPVNEIARILGPEIRRSGENSTISRGQKIVYAPEVWIRKVIDTEIHEINRQKNNDNYQFKIA